MKKKNRSRKQIRRKRLKRSKTPNLNLISDFSKSSDHLMFSMVGANYLVSDYDEGSWTPIFDEISTPLSLEQQQQQIVIKAHSESESEEMALSSHFLIPCSWVMLPSQVKKDIYDRLINDYGTDFLTGERDLEVWKFFSEFKSLISDFVSEKRII